jgi:predicted metal-binding membrane protein
MESSVVPAWTPLTATDIGLNRGGLPRGPLSSLERGQLALLLTLLVVTIGAWLLTIHQAQSMDMPMGVVVRGGSIASDQAVSTDGMAGMDSTAMDDAGEMAAMGMAGAGWSLAGFVAFVVVWAVMMAAMMFPAAAPMLLLYRTVATQRQARGDAFVPTWVFAAGYLLVWTVVGALTWVLVQAASELAGRLGTAERATWVPIALGAVLMVAGLYQLTPLKQVCLDHCRSPFAFVMQHWREGYGGSLRMGLVHGLYCLGCCWALFAVLVAAGVMSLAWMLALTLIVFAEKILPIGRRTSQVVGVAFLVLGIVVASGAADLPWTA